LLPSSKCINRKSLGDASEALKVNLSSGLFISSYFTDWWPEHEFLGLHSLELLNPLLFNIAFNFRVITHKLTDQFEAVFDLLLLEDPHVASAPHKPDFNHIGQGQKPKWKFKLLQQRGCQPQSLFVALLDDSSFLLCHD
ncbi:unnamed protein product, partial [Prunus brigantina]